VGKRSDFGFSWSEVVANWYLGKSPLIPDDISWEALGALERLWTEYIDKILSKGHKGLAVMAPVIDLGIALKACENLVGFDKVLERMKQGEQAAFSELFFTAELVKIGYVPVLGPLLHGKRLDALVCVQDKQVYIEIITPELSDGMKQAYAGMHDLADRLREQNPGTNIDVYFLAEPTSDGLDTILNFVKEITDSQYNTTLEIPGVAFLRYVPCRLQESPVKQEPSDSHLPIQSSTFEPVSNTLGLPILTVIGMAGRTGKAGVISRTNIRIPLTDERAERLMVGEAHHFSHQERNLLAIDVSRIPRGIRCWSALIQRRFQPNRNRRVGAVVLFVGHTQTESAIVKRRWSVLQNPYAYRPLPESLLNAIMRLNDSSV